MSSPYSDIEGRTEVMNTSPNVGWLTKIVIGAIFIFMLTLVFAQFVPQYYIQERHEFGQHAFFDKMQIEKEVNLSVANTYSLGFVFDKTDITKVENWQQYMGGAQWKHGKRVNPGETIQLQVVSIDETGKEVIENLDIQGSSPCPTNNICRYSPRLFLNSGKNSIRLFLSNSDEFFDNLEFDVYLMLDGSPTSKSSILYWLVHLAQGFFLPTLMLTILIVFAFILVKLSQYLNKD